MTIKNILLIGYTGSGKSTLANVLLNGDGDDFKEEFKESANGSSETRIVQKEEFRDKDVNYLIIDTPGIGDTKLKLNEILDIIAEAVYLVKDGVNKVFFVISGRFEQKNMNTYNILRSIIFDQEITNYTTIVRTRFAEFRKKNFCEDDIGAMISEKSELKEIIESCNKRVIHVDNPPINVKNEKEELIFSPLNKKTRVKSWGKLLKHLKENCQDVYKPPKLQKLSQEIATDYFQYIELKKNFEEEMTKIKSDQSSKVDDDDKRIEDPQQPTKKSANLAVGEKTTELISQLEKEKAGLKKQIEEKEQIIRQKVLKHIFSNYDGISRESGGDTFLDSIVGDDNWAEVNSEFANEKLIIEWLKEGFNYQQMKKWAEVLKDSKNGFSPERDFGFVVWLRGTKKLSVEKIQEPRHVYDIEELRKQYQAQLEEEIDVFVRYKKKLISDQVANSSEDLGNERKELLKKSLDLKSQLKKLLRQKKELEEELLEREKELDHIHKERKYSEERLEEMYVLVRNKEDELAATSIFSRKRKEELRKELDHIHKERKYSEEKLDQIHKQRQHLQKDEEELETKLEKIARETDKTKAKIETLEDEIHYQSRKQGEKIIYAEEGNVIIGGEFTIAQQQISPKNK